MNNGRRIASLFLLFGLAFLLGMPRAAAQTIDPDDPIIAISPAGACSTGGTNNLCNGGSPYSLTSLLDGNLGFQVASINGAGSWVVENDTGESLKSLTLYYSGTLDSNHFLDLQVNGWSASTVPFSDCTITTATSVVTSGCSNNTAPGPALPAQLVWSEGTTGLGLAPGEKFDLTISSFDTAHSDKGCISGTSTCTPVPEPSSLLLLGTGLMGLGAGLRKKLFSR